MLSIGTGIDGSSGLYFSLNGGPEVKLFDIDTSKLEAAALPGGMLDLNGLLTELSSEFSGTINELAGQQIVQPGQAAGLLSPIVPSPAAIPAPSSTSGSSRSSRRGGQGRPGVCLCGRRRSHAAGWAWAQAMIFRDPWIGSPPSVTSSGTQ